MKAVKNRYPTTGLSSGTENTSTFLSVRGLEKKFSARTVLRDLDLQVARGEFVILCGPNGAGKSTLLRLLAGLERPDRGAVEINRQDPRGAARSRIGYLSHASNLYEELTPQENLRFFAEMYRLEDADCRVEQALDRARLTSRRGDAVQVLSRGMVRRLAVSRAMLAQPDLLLLDEPFAGIDFESQQALLALLGQAQSSGCTVVISTHDPSLLDIRDFRLLVLKDARLAYNAPCLSTAQAHAVYCSLLEGESLGAARWAGQDPAAIPTAYPRETASLLPAIGWRDYLLQTWAVFRKDLVTEIRSREMIHYMLLYALTALIIYSFAFNLMAQSARSFVPGILWTTLVFSGILGLSRSVNREYRSGAMDVLRIAPLEPSAVFLGKLAGVYLPLLLLSLGIMLASWILFDVNLFSAGVSLTVVVGLFGFSAAGTLIATLSEKTRVREILLPILLLPLLIPLLMACIYTDVNLLNGLGIAASAGWLRILVLYDLLLLAAGLITYDFVIND